MKNLFKSIFGFPMGHKEKHQPFKVIFSLFREVLDNNNRALEIIADMGDKLGGDYLFDINYIKNTYAKLSASLGSSLHDFHSLTRRKYLKLNDAFERINNMIGRVLYDLPSSAAEAAVFYENIAWGMSHEVGGKNANLAELKNYLKLNVPDAFVITTRAFEEFIGYNNLSKKIEAVFENAGVNEQGLNELQDSIVKAKMPPDVGAAVDSALERLGKICGTNCRLAVRSSAPEEDGEFSFAGQFETVLNIPLKKEAVEEAYKRVLASLFSAKAVSYQKRIGYEAGKLEMAVGCMAMVDATASGVVYSSNPDGDRGSLIINAAWGIGKSVVEGLTDADIYKVKKDIKPEIIDMHIGKKDLMTVNLKEGGAETIKTPEDIKDKPCLTDAQIEELTALAIGIEKYFRKPQDIEWAIDKDGRIFILQSRPLRIMEPQDVIGKSEAPKQSLQTTVIASPPARNDRILMKDKGVVVQKGVAAGRVFIVKHPEELENFPKGAILVAKHDSSDFVRVMPYASAIITDVGTPTSHMSSLSREFRVPTIVNTGDATLILEHGREVTVRAGDEAEVTVYDGIVRELLKQAEEGFIRMDELYEFRKKRYILRYVTPLNLIDPLLDNFTPEACKTMHDIIRFIHEKSVAELIENARRENSMFKEHAAVRLELPVPAGIFVIDTGGGLDIPEGQGKATFEQITSVPLKAIVKGMMHPGVWHSEAVSLKLNDFISSMIRMSDITTESSDYIGYNVAVASREYVNLSLRFGYHFNMIDCYCSENMRNNHIYFRFVGGATDIVKRSRRIELLAIVLKEYGFNIKIKGDLIIARIGNLKKETVEDILDHAGRLIAYTRQLDAVLHDDASVGRYAEKFIKGEYEL